MTIDGMGRDSLLWSVQACLARKEVADEYQLLRERQYERPERGDVGLERLARGLHHLAPDLCPGFALIVVPLDHTAAEAAQTCSFRVEQKV